MPMTARFALFAALLLAAAAPAAAPPRQVDSDRVTVLLQMLDDDDFETRRAADDELRTLGRAVLPYLHDEHLRTASLEVRDRLGRMIRDLTVDERVPDLVKMLTHAEGRFRIHAAHCLRQLGPDQLPALEAALDRAASPSGRQLLQQLIAELKSPR